VAVKIRMKMMGRKHRPFFRVCAMDSRSPRDGRVIEELGTYDPLVPETDARAILKGERIDYWIGVGAQPSPKVGVLIRKYGTNGSHLQQQSDALGRLGGRKAQSIEQARVAAGKVPKPKKVVEVVAEVDETASLPVADNASEGLNTVESEQTNTETIAEN
jgi:small subunit ribosomal protein S16